MLTATSVLSDDTVLPCSRTRIAHWTPTTEPETLHSNVTPFDPGDGQSADGAGTRAVPVPASRSAARRFARIVLGIRSRLFHRLQPPADGPVGRTPREHGRYRPRPRRGRLLQVTRTGDSRPRRQRRRHP